MAASTAAPKGEMDSAQVRAKLVDALELDLVGPHPASGSETEDQLGDPDEILPQSPSRWYLTGFLAPRDAPPEQRADPTADDDDFDLSSEPGVDDETLPERGAAGKQKYLPSSMGVSVLLPQGANIVRVLVQWGDYKREGSGESEEWHRTPREERLEFILSEPSREKKVPHSGGLRVALNISPVGTLHDGSGVPAGSNTISIFLVNQRAAREADEYKDESFAFQTKIAIEADRPFLARPNTRGLMSEDWDENVADLQYRDLSEYAVGHNVAAAGDGDAVGTCWIPSAHVDRVAAASIGGATFEMDVLATLADGADASSKLTPLVRQYREWISKQRVELSADTSLPAKRAKTATKLLKGAEHAANRMERGIDLLSAPHNLKAFKLANKVMALASRRRNGPMKGKTVADAPTPRWRPFQLAFLLMNLPGMVDPTAASDRETVDLLFFPTGGGKTEAYLGLAAFTLVLRRLRNPGITGAGVSVLMRYTLRLLTLDQLGRAATLICALELERELDAELGDWQFEIGLWVGSAATPNHMGDVTKNHPYTARYRTLEYLNDERKPSPIPLEECPWCGEKFKQVSFKLKPTRNNPTDLIIGCVNRDCDFSRDRTLPIVAVDEPLYRRLPCFIIATVDKFAAMPWTGLVAGLFGRVQRFDKEGFYGPMTPGQGSFLPAGRLLPPDLIIQDELHLISGPLGTMVGLYETALEELAVVDSIRPKIIASTATVRRAESQIRALFDRDTVEIFPPPGPDRRDSFFAKTLRPVAADNDTNPRLYLGVAAQGRSPKVVMLRVYLALLAAGQKWYSISGKKSPDNPADPYMTLIGYFNALRELGGARRLIEDEVRNGLLRYGTRKRVGETDGEFVKRSIGYEPVELTSRVSTSDVAANKRRLELPFSDENHADVAIATNMISVGLDITRLGLMVVFGQPKTSAEYIQASSRVGRVPHKPGLVVTILNAHKPRDRSHYERFAAYHESFYRSVEASSVTPFSPRALDRGLAASLVSLSRLGTTAMTPPSGAMEVGTQSATMEAAVSRFAERAFRHAQTGVEEQTRLKATVRTRAAALVSDWSAAVESKREVGAKLQYNARENPGGGNPLLHDFLDTDLRNLPPSDWKMKFRANRSMRDVEPNVSLWVKRLESPEMDDDQ